MSAPTDTAATDAALLARFRGGDASALDPLFARYEEPVFRFLFGVLRDHHAAEDALQETFVQALRNDALSSNVQVHTGGPASCPCRPTGRSRPGRSSRWR